MLNNRKTIVLFFFFVIGIYACGNNKHKFVDMEDSFPIDLRINDLPIENLEVILKNAPREYIVRNYARRIQSSKKENLGTAFFYKGNGEEIDTIPISYGTPKVTHIEIYRDTVQLWLELRYEDKHPLYVIGKPNWFSCLYYSGNGEILGGSIGGEFCTLSPDTKDLKLFYAEKEMQLRNGNIDLDKENSLWFKEFLEIK